jgi:sialate O-acetylesterase
VHGPETHTSISTTAPLIGRAAGESDCREPFASKYACTFPAMVAAWRAAWHAGTDGVTDPEFPFGFVQLSVWGNPANPPVVGEPIAVVRWGQTANYGYVPNPVLPNVFMATAIDLGAYEGGCGHDAFPSLCIHPGWKAEVGRRLVRGMLNVGYGDNTSYYSGPVLKAALATESGVAVIFRAVAEGGLEIYEKEGFEVSVDHGASWTAVMVTAVTGDTVTLAVPNASRITSVRYLWSGVPCTHPHFSVGKCSVYSGGLPATPFIANVTDIV